MEKQILISADFFQLKGLKNAHIDFSKTLTAIMGTNGSGKTTVIHALVCAFSPENNQIPNYKFSYFFAPNTDSSWSGSHFKLKYQRTNSNGNPEEINREYKKGMDRWTPRYINQPKRNVYYIGIESCLPEIEKSYTTGRINYKSIKLTEKEDQKVAIAAAYILNKQYDCLLDNKFKGRHLMGVELRNGIKYSSLSMGTGEQRVIKILRLLYNAEPYSLFLIDEIDLLLHVSSLHKLIKKVYEIANSKHIQVVFTTHSLEMMKMNKYVSVQYLYHHGNDETMVYNRITSDLVYDLTGERTSPYTVYCEDCLARSVIETIIRKENLASKVNVVTFGAIENAFTLAASWAITNDDAINKSLIMLDGDKYNSNEEKMKLIQKRFTGTEYGVEEKWNRAVHVISQFNLPPETAPEKYLYDLIIAYYPPEDELYDTALGIEAVNDTHEWIYSISRRLGMNIEILINDIVTKIYSADEFQEYCSHLQDWLSAVKEQEQLQLHQEPILEGV